MKITRLKSGYRLRVTDAEFEMLNSLIVDGFMMYEGDDNVTVSHGWSAPQKAALTRALRKSGGDMQILRAIDDDHREPLATEPHQHGAGNGEKHGG